MEEKPKTLEKLEALEKPEPETLDPYDVLFPVGILTSLLAAFLWVAFQNSWVSFFPRQTHGNLMFFGFLWAFVSGFLMTAIPKMTQTSIANIFEIFAAVFLVLLQWVLNLRNMGSVSVGLFALQVFVLILFVGRRFLQRRQIPFEGFVYFPFALFWGLAGPFSFFLFPQFGSSMLYVFSGQAVILNLICGLGSRLIPVLSRIPGALMPDAAGQHKRMIEIGLYAICLNLTFVLEALGATQAGYLIRAIFISAVAVRYFKVFTRPSVRTYVGWGLKSAVICLIVGYGLLGVFPEGSSLPFLHLVYIGGYSLITLMVATRVTLAHGGYSLELELKSKHIVFIFLILLIGAALRAFVVGSDLVAKGLSWSAYAFMVGLGAWLISWWIRATKLIKQV